MSCYRDSHDRHSEEIGLEQLEQDFVRPDCHDTFQPPDLRDLLAKLETVPLRVNTNFASSVVRMPRWCTTPRPLFLWRLQAGSHHRHRFSTRYLFAAVNSTV